MSWIYAIFHTCINKVLFLHFDVQPTGTSWQVQQRNTLRRVALYADDIRSCYIHFFQVQETAFWLNS